MSIDTEGRYLCLALEDASRCIADISGLILQSPEQRDHAKMGGIAAGLKRAAAHALGKPFEPEVDPKHADDGGTMSRDKPGIAAAQPRRWQHVTEGTIFEELARGPGMRSEGDLVLCREAAPPHRLEGFLAEEFNDGRFVEVLPSISMHAGTQILGLDPAAPHSEIVSLGGEPMPAGEALRRLFAPRTEEAVTAWAMIAEGAVVVNMNEGVDVNSPGAAPATEFKPWDNANRDYWRQEYHKAKEPRRALRELVILALGELHEQADVISAEEGVAMQGAFLPRVIQNWMSEDQGPAIDLAVVRRTLHALFLQGRVLIPMLGMYALDRSTE